MDDVLLLVHRMPYPPNKGDKLRSFHLLKRLSARYRVYLGTFVDDPTDWRHAERLRAYCKEACFLSLHPRMAKIRSLGGLLTRDALSVRYYLDGRLARWVDSIVTRHGVTRMVAFSSPMAQYLLPFPSARRIADMVDVDSAKWGAYAQRSRWPLTWLYRREARMLLEFEKKIASTHDASVFVSAAEAELFRRMSGVGGERVHFAVNGVDVQYFSPSEAYPNPYGGASKVLVFTGVMDYWPNCDAVQWFAEHAFPGIRRRWTDARFVIAGMRPTPAVRRLAQIDGVEVTGAVDDVRPYIRHAAAVVAPLRIARGVQNKVLEGMAMGKTVIASPGAVEGIDVRAGEEILVAETAAEFIEAVDAVFEGTCKAGHGPAIASSRRTVGNITSIRCFLSLKQALMVHQVSPALPLDVESLSRPDSALPADREALKSRKQVDSALPFSLLAAVLFWVIAWHWDTAASMVEIWWRSETFAHGMVVYPISLWLIWRARKHLSGIQIAPAYWVVLLIAAFSGAWLLGDLGGVQAARHFALVAIIALVVWTMLGTSVATAIAFPLAFTLLAVPIGEFLLPMLMEQTADFTVGALRLTGIPVYREGNNFVVPSGSWSVVEACSGLRYLIASITLGLLYAYLSYTSFVRRTCFVLASIIVPIVANWIRAYMIVMIGHLSGMKYAVGVDHLIYGWVFFGVVMLLLFWMGSFWREDVPSGEARRNPARTIEHESSHPAGGMLVAGVLIAALVTVAPSYSDAVVSEPRLAYGNFPAPDPTNGWGFAERDPSEMFRPHYPGARVQMEQRYVRNGQSVGLYIAFYAGQRRGTELIGSDNSLVPVGDRRWMLISQDSVSALGDPPAVQRAVLRSVEGELLVWHWYWIGGRWSADPRFAKLLQALNKLARNDDASALVLVYAPSSGGKSASSGDVLRQFVADMSPAIAQTLADFRSEQIASISR